MREIITGGILVDNIALIESCTVSEDFKIFRFLIGYFLK